MEKKAKKNVGGSEEKRITESLEASATVYFFRSTPVKPINLKPPQA